MLLYLQVLPVGYRAPGHEASGLGRAQCSADMAHRTANSLRDGVYRSRNRNGRRYRIFVDFEFSCDRLSPVDRRDVDVHQLGVHHRRKVHRKALEYGTLYRRKLENRSALAVAGRKEEHVVVGQHSAWKSAFSTVVAVEAAVRNLDLEIFDIAECGGIIGLYRMNARHAKSRMRGSRVYLLLASSLNNMPCKWSIAGKFKLVAESRRNNSKKRSHSTEMQRIAKGDVVGRSGKAKRGVGERKGQGVAVALDWMIK